MAEKSLSVETRRERAGGARLEKCFGSKLSRLSRPGGVRGVAGSGLDATALDDDVRVATDIRAAARSCLDAAAPDDDVRCLRGAGLAHREGHGAAFGTADSLDGGLEAEVDHGGAVDAEDRIAWREAGF